MHTLLADYKKGYDELNPSLGLSNSAEYSNFRKIWREGTESVLSILERSDASLRYTPAEISICAMLSCESDSRTKATHQRPVYSDYSLRNYLSHRFGTVESESLLARATEVSNLIKTVLDADANEAQFKEASSFIKKNSVWGKKGKKSSK
jgi:hypothetical protein